MRTAADQLDYMALIKEAKKLDTGACTKTVRLAILADFAGQQLVTILKVLFARNKVKLELYEADYDSIDFEILNPQSGLYTFQPQFVAILAASEKLKTRFYEAADRAAFVAETADRYSNLWNVLKSNNPAVTVIQGNFVMPLERAFGNYEQLAPHSLGATFAAINQRMIEAARATKSVLLCDIDYLAGMVGRLNWSDERLWNLAKSPCRLDHLPLLAQSITDVALSAAGHFTKCVVLDLDNTLWGGVIGDDGVSGIALGDFDEGEAFVAFQKFIRELKARGIILAVVSKNEHAAAILPFREHPRMVLKEEDIAVFIANWDNKADNIRQVQKVLNIGFDSLVFLDDNPFERNIVRQYLPDVVVPELPEDPSMYVRAISQYNLFETATYSAADGQRADQYRQEAQRELTKTSFTNVAEYLASLDMKIKLERFNNFNLPRIAQLIQRSNQFNLATNRYGEAACEAFMKDGEAVPFTLTMADKYGDYGLISVIILKFANDDLVIDEYLMSCRVLQRGGRGFRHEQHLRAGRQAQSKRVVGRYNKTAKNDMVKNFYAGFGFEQIEKTANDDSIWALDVESYKPRDTFLNPTINEIEKARN